jgi:DNA-binding NarL/FixJ family response regulator
VRKRDALPKLDTIATVVAGSPEHERREIADGLRANPRIDVLDDDRRPDVLVVLAPGSARMDVPTVSLVDDVREAWSADSAGHGPRAFLERSAPAPEIAAAVIAVGAGLVAAPPHAFAADAAPRARDLVERLTPREVEVLAELARGSATKHIAARLAISEHTVKFHIASIFAKLGVSSRTGAVTQAVRLGLIML